MRTFSCWTAPLTLVALAIGCNTVDPSQCFPNTSGGFGGSGELPIGAGVGATTGGFGAPPPKRPLDYGDPPNPCIMPPTPCVGKCLDAYETAAGQCGLIAVQAQRRTCQDAAYANYKICDAACKKSDDCKEACKKKCDNIHDICHAACTKKDPTSSCHAKCNDEYGACLKQCDQKCG